MALSSHITTGKRSITMTSFHSSNDGRRNQNNPEEAAGLDETEDLPLSPEEDMPVIPDDERVLDVPS
jgi:hypothetical protein